MNNTATTKGNSMSHNVIWMDTEKALIFDLKESGIEKSHVQRREIKHHTFNSKDHHGDPSIEHFYKDLAVKLNGVEELLILGPGEAKTHFKTFLETHYASGLAKKIIGVESSDHPTDNQILAAGRKFFKTYNLFNHPIKAAGE
ncbi:MAG: hypothetical protein ACXVA9_08205, partial [Bdellovibrionales bacterium]